MLRFDVYRDGGPAEQISLAGAYVFGQDYIPVRADLAAANGQITCIKHVPGACGVALLWDVDEAGTYLLPTTRLPERTDPYNLNIELARSQVMRIAQKQEDWGLFDYAGAGGLNEEFADVRRLFTDSLKSRDPAKAAAIADRAIGRGITLGEKIALFHADVFLSRRKLTPTTDGGAYFGCVADLAAPPNGYRKLLRENFDFVSIPTPWKHLEPKERQYEHGTVDTWMNWAVKAGKRIHAGPLLSFDPMHLPDWLYIWENDFDTLRDLIYEHVQHTVDRYKRHVRAWNVVSGIHANNSFNLSFEQLMELTRMTCLLVKKIAPRRQVMIELTLPWGEYYSRNQRTIPPLLYADMAVQSGIKFDAFGLQVFMGMPADGYYVRDLMQISAMLDEFVSLGKPLHVTACQVPSEAAPPAPEATEPGQSALEAGRWHAPWSQRLQAEWLQAFLRISLSKPFIETVCWRDLADHEAYHMPHGGLCRDTMEPKLAYRELYNFRTSLYAGNFIPATNQQPGGDK